MRLVEKCAGRPQAFFQQLAAPKVFNGLNTFDEHLWTCASLNVRRNPRWSGELHFSTTSEIGEEKRRGRTHRFLRTFEPFRELWGEFFAATSEQLWNRVES